MKTLSNITLCAVSSVKIKETIRALKKSMRGITYARVLLLTDIDITEPNVEVINIRKLGYDDYSHFIAFELKDYIKTDFVLLVQHDGYVLRPNKWDDAFLQYDYIGAPWRKDLHFDQYGTNIRIGNGGFSLRSKKFLEAPSLLRLPFTDKDTGFFHEDGLLCLYYRRELENAGMRFAPVEIASRFSRERWCSDSVLFPFGFHSNRRGLNFFRRIIRKLVI